jgi:uncharacterized protein with NRDE domain
MCTLLIWNHLHPRYPVVAAANRDEFLDRAATGPETLIDDPLAVGGRDAVAGGTWFTMTELGLLFALTNRRNAGAHDPTKRSRGLLVLEVACSKSFGEACERLRRVDAAAYNPFVLLVADARNAAAAHAGADGTRLISIDKGAHAITNWDLDADSPPKAARAKRIASEFPIQTFDDEDMLAKSIHALLADHCDEAGSAEALCVHRPESGYGTRSSSIALIGRSPAQTRLYHAEGPPCLAALGDVTNLLRHETAAPSPKSYAKGL